jgi:archaellum component FlaC
MEGILQMARTRNTMNLFEVMDAVDAIDERLKKVEEYSHEPQNYKKKCDEMEERIKKLERRIKFKKMYNR